MQRYLLFDAGCAVCNQLARAIAEAAGGKLEVMSIHERQAWKWLDRAYPTGWAYRPYLVTVDGERVRVYAGAGMALRLGWLLGPRKAWRVWNLAQRSGILFPPGGNITPHATSRRQFLKAGFAATVAAVVGKLGLQPASVAHACIPCENCPMYYIRYPCYTTGWVCGDPGEVDTSERRDYYDSATGEYCYTTIIWWCDFICV